MPNDLRTQAIVLRRTNYSESDRILNLLTPEGKIAVLAKGVRKEKSKLAGGIELFSVADVVVHQGRSNLGTLTSARMQCFYSNILSDFTRLELASEILKKSEKASEQIDNPDYFDFVNQALAGLDRKSSPEVVRAWFILNLAQAMGEEINLSADINEESLIAESHYLWDHAEGALRPDPHGLIGAAEIKLGRIILTSRLEIVLRIAGVNDLVRALTPLVRAFE